MMIINFGDAYARKPEEKDIDAIVAYRNDPDVFASLGGHFNGMSREDARQWIEYHRANTSDLVWILATNHAGRCVGHCGLYKIDYRIGKAELGMAIAKSHWGNGLGGRVLSGLIDYAYKQLRIHRIETYSLETNKKITQMKDNLGFTCEGVLRDHEYRNGQYLNVLVMTILENEWNGTPEKYRWKVPGVTES